MTTKERIYLALSTDSELTAMYNFGAPRLFYLVGPDNPTPDGEFAYTVFRPFPVGSQIYTLDVPAIPGLYWRKFAFETWATDSTTLGIPGPDRADAIANRIEQVLKMIAEPTGINGVYPETPIAIWSSTERAAMTAQNFYMHSGLL